MSSRPSLCPIQFGLPGIRPGVAWRPAIGLVVLWVGCAGGVGAPAAPAPRSVLDSVAVLDGAVGIPVERGTLLRRLAEADLVLLGELHDNPMHHRVRGELLQWGPSRRPVVVFEQFPVSHGPIRPPGPGEALEAWLDANGFDRVAWRWPLHRPVIEAALAIEAELWGSGVSREALRSVVRDGISGAEEALRRMVEEVPLEPDERAELDRVLVEGHCGALPEPMIPGLRAAQAVRDAAMTRALLAGARSRPAWLIAGNGHVRKDFGVPRLLRRLGSGYRVLVVGLLEYRPGGLLPAEAERRRYDVVIVTPPAERSDPCAVFRR